jgi:hypothetical protein
MADVARVSAKPASGKRIVDKQAFYRLCREWHGYLSAVAFVALLFFSATGIVMNHPGITDNDLPALIQRPFVLSPAEIATIRANPDPGQTLVRTAERHGGKLAGGFRDGQKDGDDIFVRLQGASSNTDLHGDLATGKVDVTIIPAKPLEILNNLHRGDRAGRLWQVLVDGSAILLIVVSLLGYILFLSMRFRTRTALLLTGATLAALVAVFFLAVP